MRFDERGLPRAVRIPARAELLRQGTGKGARHRDLHPLLPRHCADRGRAEFLTYARQVLDQASLLEERYKNAKPRKQLCTVSTQHYMFAVEAFVEMINSIKSDEYEFTIRETRTHDIIDSVANMRSDLGIIYLSDFNKDVIGKLLREKHLEFHPCSARHCTCSSRATIHSPRRSSSP